MNIFWTILNWILLPKLTIKYNSILVKHYHDQMKKQLTNVGTELMS